MEKKGHCQFAEEGGSTDEEKENCRNIQIYKIALGFSVRILSK